MSKYLPSAHSLYAMPLSFNVQKEWIKGAEDNDI